MKSLIANDTVQIELLNRCPKRCANCTRFVSHVPKPFVMDFKTFQRAVDSMVGFPRMVGFQGGEVLTHPEFEKFCAYALTKIPRARLGLWTCFPKGYEHYRETICRTFGSIFLNSHERSDIMHHPFLVAIEEVQPHKGKMWNAIDNCWAQRDWSASINPNGAWFCEMAASLNVLFDEGDNGWPVEPGWLWRTPKDYRDQMERYCPRCGGAARLKRRPSTDRVDDISPRNLVRLRDRSPRIKAGHFVVSDCRQVPLCEQGAMQSYKDQGYRDVIAARYGIYLTLKRDGFCEPHLMRSERRLQAQPALMEQLQTQYM